MRRNLQSLTDTNFRLEDRPRNSQRRDLTSLPLGRDIRKDSTLTSQSSTGDPVHEPTSEEMP